MSSLPFPSIWVPQRHWFCPNCGKPRLLRRSVARAKGWLRKLIDPIAAYAQGDLMIGPSGELLLDSSGNLLLDDGSGNACCCGSGTSSPCTCHGTSNYNSKKVVTISGWSMTETSGSCVWDGNTPGTYYSITTAFDLNGTWCLSYNSSISSPNSYCGWSVAIPCSITAYNTTGCTGLVTGTCSQMLLAVVIASGSSIANGFINSFYAVTNGTGSLDNKNAFVNNTANTYALACGGSVTVPNLTSNFLQGGTADISGGSAVISDTTC